MLSKLPNFSQEREIVANSSWKELEPSKDELDDYLIGEYRIVGSSEHQLWLSDEDPCSRLFMGVG